MSMGGGNRWIGTIKARVSKICTRKMFDHIIQEINHSTCKKYVYESVAMI